MNTRPNKESKKIAEELANLIMAGSRDNNNESNNYNDYDSEQITRLKRELGLSVHTADTLESYGDFYEDEEDEPGVEERVGIWKLEVINGQEYYVRDPKFDSEFALWARVPRIPPKSNKRRICFLGESVARGFLFSPRWTPAKVLEQILNLNPDIPGSEVIDLSRTNSTMRELMQIVTSCVALHPDAVVIFAGNNWSLDIEITDSDLRKMMEVIENTSRFRDLKRLLEEKYIRLVSDFIKYIGDLSAAHGIPFTFIIPEFNLLDWHSNEREKRLLFPRDESGQWYGLLREAQEAADQGHLEQMESLHGQMIALNEANPYSYELLAQCKLKYNRLADAVKYFRLAHDTTIFRMYHIPGILSITQQTLLQDCQRYVIAVVDLPGIFNRYEEDLEPGRRLFLDYCHLTAEGIRIAMTHTARCLLSQLTGREVPLDETRIREITPDAREEGIAHLFAAVHNAHWGQSSDIVYYHCVKALELSREIGDYMSNYASMAVRHTPWVISVEFEKFADAMFANSYSLNQPEGQEVLDTLLVDALIRVLKTIDIDIKDKIDRLRIREHGFINGEINLLESYYHRTCAQELIMKSTYYHQAFDIESRFFLVTAKVPQILLDITCRTPVTPSTGQGQLIKIIINETLVSTLPAGKEWNRHSVKVPAGVLIDGINQIIIQWPMFDGQPEIERRQYESLGDFFRRRSMLVFGEIHMFRALKEKPV